MVEATPRATTQNARKQRNDRLVRRLTTTATTCAVGLTGIFAGFSASTVSSHSTATPPEQLGPAAELGPASDAALAKAIADYASAAAPRLAAAPSRHVVPAAPNRHVAVPTPRPLAPRHPAVAVSGGS
jgi:hypothetical protein